jgi:predicted nucleic acid-binding protein
MRYGLDTTFLVAVEVACHADHVAARRFADSVRQQGDRFAIAPQVIAEFIHIVTDPKRFSAPLKMAQAVDRAQIWWDAEDVDRVLPSDETVTWFLAALAKYRLGRKRLLDTLLAGTYRSAGISSILTLNPADFAVFNEFACVPTTAD